jgi:hypothetical protein
MANPGVTKGKKVAYVENGRANLPPLYFSVYLITHGRISIHNKLKTFINLFEPVKIVLEL